MWLVVSLRLVHLMHTCGLIILMQAAMSAAGVEFAGFLFVDDNNLIALALTKTETAHQVVATAVSGPQEVPSNQKNARGALRITCGREANGISLAWKTCHAICWRQILMAI
jgi:hypothetical protein